ncbi:MAG: cysteine--tRNA ligase [Candidatus Falkowbacteria bacterium]|nr:cysteine--tRNA ligase [Candidatus Falkowbacteria bacterium]
MKEIYLYNTLSRQKEIFAPLKKGRVSFYYCGPTVYWTQHIGNLRGMVCADLINRSFDYLGYRVKMVRNYTDVGHLSSDNDEGEDKMATGAMRESLAPAAIAEKYIKIYQQDTAALNIINPTFTPRATDQIKEIISFVKVLLAKGYAYTTKLAIYFAVDKFPEYSKLSRQDLSKNISSAGHGAVSDSEKKNPADFALWFFKAGSHKKALQFWPSPFYSPLVKDGEGFPGWHIECSVMVKRYLGDTIDIHMGGIEHIPVHHTNEIATSEAANGVKFVDYWLHNAHLLVDNKKMAKSEGTSYSLADIKVRNFNPIALRYFFLQAHYRSNQNFTWEALGAAQSGLDNLFNKIRELAVKPGRVDKKWQEKFIEIIANDFNIPASLALITEIFKSDLSPAVKLATLFDFDKIWGLNLKVAAKFKAATIPIEIKKLLVLREEARAAKNFSRSDELRKELESMGYKVEDNEAGSRAIKI